MPNAFETPWVTLEVNDVPLSLWNDPGHSKWPKFQQTKSQNDFIEQFFLLPSQPSHSGWESLQSIL